MHALWISVSSALKCKAKAHIAARNLFSLLLGSCLKCDKEDWYEEVIRALELVSKQLGN